jgi:hypothetical protein
MEEVMIIVRVELHSAITGKIIELARIKIWNDVSGTNTRRNYQAISFRGRSTKQLNKETVIKHTELKEWPSKQLHVWNLVRAVLTNLGYTEGQ